MLFHFSEEADIEVFIPREKQNRSDFPAVVKPVGIEKVDRLVERLLSKGIELRVTPNLRPLRESIVSSDFKEFGIHRFNNAK